MNAAERGLEGPPITWVDIARALSALDPASDKWRSRPAGLHRVRVDWTEALFQVEPNSTDRVAVSAWLKEVVPGLLISADGECILLEGPRGLERLPIELEESTTEKRVSRPSLGAVEGEITFVPLRYEINPRSRPVPVIACHSVKGGTGRTTSALAVASIWQRRASAPILVVDADIEAPGLSYLFVESGVEARISFEDLTALAHALPDPDKSSVAQWIGDRVASHRVGQLIVLPLRRALNELASSTIRAEHLASPNNPYALADLLSLTAAYAGCAGVVVDVRAGLVPVAAQLILDPTVPRVLTTTLSGQSVKATGNLMTFVGREFRKLGAEQAPPLIIVNRIPNILREFGTDDRILDPVLDEIERSLVPDEDVDVGPEDTVLNTDIALRPFMLTKVSEIPDLAVPRSRWEDFAIQLETSGFTRQLDAPISEWLDRVIRPLEPSSTDQERSQPASRPPESPQVRRDKLSSFANDMIFAESKRPTEIPLITGALRAFAQEGQAPIVVSEGGKGTGKTLTARYFVSKGTWQTAMEDIRAGTKSVDAEIVPVVSSAVGGAEYVQEVDQRRATASASLGLKGPQSLTQSRDALATAVATSRTQPEWTSTWLDVIAWAAGFEAGRSGAGERLLSHLRATERRMVAIVEGIEEIQPSSEQNSLSSMLGSLLIDLPARLRTEQGRPLGLIVFARRDTVEAGVRQNLGQFRQQYREFALTWDEADVLELAAWLATKSEVLHIWSSDFRSLDRAQQERLLEALWGRKLGPDDREGRRTQEAYTANWVLAVLSDLQGRLTARDLVRFIKEASATPVTSQDETLYASRLLAPLALRRAVGPTSDAKVEEIQEEVPGLKSVFAKIRQHKNAIKAPISQESMVDVGIGSEELSLLRTHGVILDESPPFEVPELFRIGLGLTHGGARRNVIGMMRRAKERRGARVA